MRNLSCVCALIVTGALVVVCPGVRADGPPRVIINELMWMGSSVSANDEWIELKNTTSAPIDLAGWRLTKLSGGAEAAMLTISSGTIPPAGFFVISNDAVETSRLAQPPQLVDASVSLVNSKLQIALYDAAGVLVDRADDGTGSPLAGEYSSGAVWKSMERNPFGVDGIVKESWHTASASVGFDDASKELGTPGSENSNRPPVITANIPSDAVVGEAAQMDASETTDAEGDALAFTWSFGDGATAVGSTASHAYQMPGTFPITLMVHDGRENATFTASITVASTPIVPSQPPQPAASTPTSLAPPIASAPDVPAVVNPVATNARVQFSELLPNPDGPDAAAEFIELANVGSEPVDLFGWKITDLAAEFTIATHLVLAPGSAHAFFRPETKIALNNSGVETLYCVNPNGKVVNGVTYKRTVAGKSFSRTAQGNWEWTTPSPSAPNVFPVADEPDRKDAADASPSSIDPEPAVVDLQKMSTLPLRTKVRVRGTVIVEPGTMGATFFYLSDGRRGLQVSSSKGGFPDLGIGDVVAVTGKVGEASGERKINVVDAADIVVTDAGDAPDPLPFTPNLPSGTLVVLDGTVAKKSGSGATIETSSGVVKIGISRGSGVASSAIAAGAAVRIVGVWRVTKDGGRLYPRSNEDIEVAGEVKGETTTAAVVPPAQPTVPNQPQTIAVPRDRASTATLVLTWAPAAAVLGVAGYVWWRRRQALSPPPPSGRGGMQ